MSLPTQGKYWIVTEKPKGQIKLSGDGSTFKLEERDVPKLKDGQILVKVQYMSNDPAQRTWLDPNIDPTRHYHTPIEDGAVMEAGGIAEVIESSSGKFKKGATVLGQFGWSEYAVVNDSLPGLREVKQLPSGLGFSHYLGALGLTGLTAYYGLVIVAEAKKGESVLVSGAAGATGSMVVQIAKKIVGASKIVGIAGSDEKCRWVESLGADKCLNYKSPSFKDDLRANGGYDVYFDNVGGEILDEALNNVNRHGRIAACGAITGYDAGHAWTSQHYFNVISMRLQIRGFIVLDYAQKFGEVLEILTKALQEGKLKIGKENETVVDTKFEDIPKTWNMLFEGSNTGKLVTHLV